MNAPRFRRAPSRSRATSAYLPVFALALVIGVVYLAMTQVVYGNRIYPGVSALGIDLGGQTVGQATAKIQTRLDQYAYQKVTIQANGLRLTVTATDLGFQPGAATLARAAYSAGRGGALPGRLIGPIVAARAPFVVPTDWDVDAPTLTNAVARIAGQVDREPVEPALIIGQNVSIRPGQDGRRLDRDGANGLIRGYLGNLRTGPLVLPVAVRHPRVSDARVVPPRDLAEKILAQPFEVTGDDHVWMISTDKLRGSLVYVDNPPSLAIAPAAFDPLVQQISHQVDRPARDATLVIAAGQIKVTPDAVGMSVDQSATRTKLRQAILAGDHSVPLVTTARNPTTRAADLSDLAATTQKRIDNGVVLTAGDVQYQLQGKQLGDLLKVSRSATGAVTVAPDQAKLSQAIAGFNNQFTRPALSTRFTWNAGQAALLGSSREGWVIDQGAAVKAVTAHWGDGKVTLPIIASPTAIDNAYLARLNQDLKGVIGERATTYVGSIPERAHNVALAAQRLNGVVVAPGAVFSFDQAIGPTTLKAGFQWGFAFTTDSQGQSRTVPSVAGGLCQVASTVFQPVFWAGYEVDERHWHLFWIKHYEDRGYIGLDATVAPEDGVDFKFKNDTDHALLIQSWTDSDEQIHVQLVGTKPDWKVQVSPEQISNVIPAPTTVLRTTSPLFASGRVIVLEAAQTGLTSRVTRQVIYPDGHVRTLNLKSVYQPANQAVLVGTG